MATNIKDCEAVNAMGLIWVWRELKALPIL